MIFFRALCVRLFHVWLWRYSFRPFPFLFFSQDYSLILKESEKKSEGDRAFFPPLFPRIIFLCGGTLVSKLFFCYMAICPCLALPACPYVFTSSLLTYLALFFSAWWSHRHAQQQQSETHPSVSHPCPHTCDYSIAFSHIHSDKHISTYTHLLSTCYFCFGTHLVVAATPDFLMNKLIPSPSCPLDLPSPSWVHFFISAYRSHEEGQNKKETILTLVFFSFFPSSPPFLLSSLYHPASLQITNSIGSCSQYILVCHHLVNTEQNKKNNSI